MKKAVKLFTVNHKSWSRAGRDRSRVIGPMSLEDLVNYFGYTLEIGHSYKPSIKTNPTTIKSFITNLNKAFDVKNARNYATDSIELIENPVAVV